MENDQLYPHIRVVLGIILGLGITTHLKGFASIIQHPHRYQWSWMHMGWACWSLITLVTFWWWEFRLTEVVIWTFGSYLFVISYCSLFFMLAAMLFPDNIREYASYEDYLLHRRRWFFGLIALINVMDIVDTQLKGAVRWHALGIAYPIHVAILLVVTAIGVATTNKRVQRIMAPAALVYQIGYFSHMYFTLTANE
jgi:hypothetical protein